MSAREKRICDICEQKPGFKFVKSKRYNDKVWICPPCLAFGRTRDVFTKKESKIKRNDLCYCESGKKYKLCHMIKDRQVKNETAKKNSRNTESDKVSEDK